MKTLRLKHVRLAVVFVAIALVLLVFLQPNRAQQSTSPESADRAESVQPSAESSTVAEQSDADAAPAPSDFEVVALEADEPSAEVAGEPVASESDASAVGAASEYAPPTYADRARVEPVRSDQDRYHTVPASTVSYEPNDAGDSRLPLSSERLTAEQPFSTESGQPKRPLLDFFSTGMGIRPASTTGGLKTFPVGSDRSVSRERHAGLDWERGRGSGVDWERGYPRGDDLRLAAYQDLKPQPADPNAGVAPSTGPSAADCGDYCGDYGDCEPACSDCCLTDPCCMPCWEFFGDVMAIRARKAQVEYAVPIDGAIVAPPAVPIQVGPTGIVDPDYEFAYRLGFTRRLNECSNIGVTYWRLESDTNDEIATEAPNVIRSMVSHPSTLDAAADFLFAGARHDIDFAVVDVDYRRIFSCGPQHQLRWLVGARYAGLDQDFAAIASSLGTEGVATRLDFDGAGPRFGLEGEWHSCRSGFFAYGKTGASFVVGNFQGRYVQTQSFDPVVVDTTWKAGWVVPILDLELGAGWQSRCGRVRLSAGYLLSAWYDTVKTSDYVGAVQANNYRDLGHSMVFDGLTARAEIRF